MIGPLLDLPGPRLLDDPASFKESPTAAWPPREPPARPSGGRRSCNASMDRLLTAYQEDLISSDELRRRMPELPMRTGSWPS
jgi:hypothetical protein